MFRISGTQSMKFILLDESLHGFYINLIVLLQLSKQILQEICTCGIVRYDSDV